MMTPRITTINPPDSSPTVESNNPIMVVVFISSASFSFILMEGGEDVKDVLDKNKTPLGRGGLKESVYGNLLGK
jgi:hypothetical protein